MCENDCRCLECDYENATNFVAHVERLRIKARNAVVVERIENEMRRRSEAIHKIVEPAGQAEAKWREINWAVYEALDTILNGGKDGALPF